MEIVIKRLHDYKTVVLPEKLLQIPVTQATIQSEVTALVERFISIEPVDDAIACGDFVALQVPDEKEGTKLLHWNIGKGYWGKEREDALLGLHTGDNGQMDDQPFQIHSVKRRKMPDIDDALARRFGFPEVSTVQQLEQYTLKQYVERMKARRMPMLCDIVLKEVVARSEFEGAEAPAQAMFDSTMAQVQAMAASGRTDMAGALSQATKMKDAPIPEMEKALWKLCEEAACGVAVGKFYARQDGAAFTREDARQQLMGYNPQFAEHPEMIPESILEAVENQFFTQYCHNCYAAHFGAQMQTVLE